MLCSTSVCVWIMQSFVTEVGAEKFVHCLEVCSLNILTLLSGTSQNSTHKPLTGVAPPPHTPFLVGWLVGRLVGFCLLYGRILICGAERPGVHSDHWLQPLKYQDYRHEL